MAPAVTDGLRARIAALLDEDDLAGAVGGQLGAVAAGPWGDPAIGAALHTLVDAVAANFFGVDGVAAVLGDTAADLTVALIGGTDPVTALARALQTLGASPIIDDAVRASVGAAVPTRLADTAVWQSLGDALAGAVGGQLGAVAAGLWGDPAIGAALHSLVDAVPASFFGVDGVAAVLGDTAADLTVAPIGGTDPVTALARALQTLGASPIIDDAVRASVGTAVPTRLADTAVWQSLDTAAVTLIAGLLAEACDEWRRPATVAARRVDSGGTGVVRGFAAGRPGTTLVADARRPPATRTLAGVTAVATRTTVTAGRGLGGGHRHRDAATVGDVGVSAIRGNRHPLRVAVDDAGRPKTAATRRASSDRGVRASIRGSAEA